MEPLNNSNTTQKALEGTRESPVARRSFIESNTVPLTLEEIKTKHIIPSFANGETLISHSDFVEAMRETVKDYYDGETIEDPVIRLSHPIQGRIPESRHKPLQICTEKDLSIYYDRMIFLLEIPTITDEVGGNLLSLTIGGVQAYNLNNLHSRKGADEYFKIFIGFKNTVCSNLKIWTDGIKTDLRVNSIGQLKGCIKTMLENYNTVFHLATMKKLESYSLTESQFAHIIGRGRLYHHLPISKRVGIKPLLLNDTQLNIVAKDFFKDNHFRGEDSGINLWRFYNLLTEATKTTYIDQFLDKSVNAFEMAEHLKAALDNKADSWYLN